MSLDPIGDLEREKRRVEDHIVDETQLWVELQHILHTDDGEQWSVKTIVDEMTKSDLRKKAWENRRADIRKELHKLRHENHLAP